ncbi:pimeloyl-ACP methyl ester carboxylesterase [Mycolicibacterium sp. BK556]|uniref:alpha/beta hydrolase n=1 Tax=Mycobacteriaceae TaxID=1762 RepID=UPI0010D8BADF|nr:MULTISPECIES: alpha/beta hydrolase [Mycobacteriaceae]MBB3601149.1 pimeloyl-ACP methyl ester carboxylesterase [Mycolicibacterium sp. BK556]MBB3630902.1 pimeloyl-ACP methyl ester carboxylesterase [Mycolicibacterium sp. BK607]MBB3748903.1 pimeloyl-ACP methyl ester carboxylesterase [Mycolicibacterium sp. BK634]TDO14885.1 alpha-beta hydrolase superfamily lysophospholipase [Mycobacterium sp. BK086]
MSIKPNPVIFIHGLWIHASAWQPWEELFTEQGYAVSAPGWPGDSDSVTATRENADALNDIGIAEIVDHYVGIIDAGGKHEVKPVVIGHSFGGLIAQELLAGGHAAAAVAIDPAPIKGVKALPLAQLRSAFPVLGNPANKHRTVSLNDKQFKYAFGNMLTEEESADLHDKWTIPGPGLPLFEDATANFHKNSPAKVDTHLVDRGPLLLTSGSDDHTVPLKVTKEVFGMYEKGGSDTEFHEFAGKGHSLTIDSGWREVADVALEWLARKGF